MFVNIHMIPEDDASAPRGALLHLLRRDPTFLLGLEHLEFPKLFLLTLAGLFLQSSTTQHSPSVLLDPLPVLHLRALGGLLFLDWPYRGKSSQADLIQSHLRLC